MPTGFYAKALEGFATAAVNWPSDDIRVILIDTADYSVDLTNHDFLNDIPAAARVAVSAATLASKAATNGILDSPVQLTFTSVTGDSIEAIVVYKHTGVESTSRLLMYIDVFAPSQLTPNGTNITLTWDTGTNKIARI